MKRVLAVIALCFALFACQTLKDAYTNPSLLTWTKAAVVSIETLKRAATPVFSVGCMIGKIPADVCALEKIAAAKADAWLLEVKPAIAAYEANPTNNNEMALKLLHDTGMAIWQSFNNLNGEAPYTVDPSVSK